MKNAFTKTIFRQISFNKTRFLSILIIVALGVAFYSGLRSTSPDMKKTADKYFDNYNFMDIEIVSPFGFNNDDVEAIKKVDGIKEVGPSYKSEVLVEVDNTSYIIKLLSQDFSTDDNINKPRLIIGRFPNDKNECVIDNKFIKDTKFNINDEISFTVDNNDILNILNFSTYKIVGIVESPQYISIEREKSMINGSEVSGFIILDNDAFKLPLYSNLYVTINKDNISRFTHEYDNKVSEIIKSLKEDNNTRYYFNINDNIGFLSYKQDTDRIAAIGNVFPLIFFLVTSLVSLTSMTRMVENDRTVIGTIKSLGYTRYSITKKYLFYALSASFLGSIIGFIIGVNLFPRVIFDSYGVLYKLPEIEILYIKNLIVTSFLSAILVVAIPAYFACVKSFMSSPANLMRPKAPKVGKRIILERIKFIWSKLNFIQKVTARNLFRYKKRFLMTIIGIAGCTSLLFTGFGLRDSISSIVDLQFNELKTYDMEIYLKDNLSYEEINQFNDYIINNQDITSSYYIKQQSIDCGNNDIKRNVYLVIPEGKEVFSNLITLRNRKSQKEVMLDDNSVILTEKLASILNVKVGDVIYLENYTHDKVDVLVGGIVENYVNHYIYMSPVLYKNLYNTEIYYNVLIAKSNNIINNDLMSQSQVRAINDISKIQDYFTDVIKTLNDVVIILIISAGLLALLVLFTLTNINIDERKRELATIKVLGFYNLEVSSYIYRENIILSILGIISGLGLGVLIHRYLIVTTETEIVMFSRKVFLNSYMYSGLITFMFAIIVNLIMYFRLRKINMIESLKNVE